ncbi:type IV fimbrial biogenesis protein FimT [Thiogranum longum]|uniref:Type II secretion system protein H n=1 Tax=Thiogranum longum TaxID=1537524 RepID=A0A4R1HI89_9GAMM|nr:GspH/FimT family pseudopilin [Thiogranum longum]TCK19139.1 type IV fimbrial biogenesis protein FimT [Thiogranum longum]
MDDAQHEGFTLVELLVSLAIAALLAAVAAPAMARFLDNARLRAATGDIARELVLARSYAYTFRKPVYFNIAVADTAWCYGWGESPACNCNSSDPPAACQTRESGLTRDHLQTSADYPQIRLMLTGLQRTSRLVRFSPIRGTATAATLLLENSNSQTRVIISILGRVRTCSPDTARFLAC